MFFTDMAYIVSCAQWGLRIIYDSHDAIVHYLYGHLEQQKDRYFDHHPHNFICLICGKHWNFLMFKYVETIIFCSFPKLVILIISKEVTINNNENRLDHRSTLS